MGGESSRGRYSPGGATTERQAAVVQVVFADACMCVPSVHGNSGITAMNEEALTYQTKIESTLKGKIM